MKKIIIHLFICLYKENKQINNIAKRFQGLWLYQTKQPPLIDGVQRWRQPALCHPFRGEGASCSKKGLTRRHPSLMGLATCDPVSPTKIYNSPKKEPIQKIHAGNSCVDKNEDWIIPISPIAFRNLSLLQLYSNTEKKAFKI